MSFRMLTLKKEQCFICLVLNQLNPIQDTIEKETDLYLGQSFVLYYKNPRESKHRT